MYRNRLLIRYGNFAFHYRDKFFPIVLIVLLMLFPLAASHGDPYFEMASSSISLAVALLGETIRILTVGLEYIKRGGVNKRVYADTLVTGGVFGHCRNPLYVGNLLIAFGLLSIPDSLPLFAVGAVLVIVTYISIVAAEEQYLRDKFGLQFDVYCEQANRWVPDFRGFGATLRGMRFNWRRILLKESSSFYGWIAFAFLIEGAEIRFSPVLFARPDAVMFAAVFTLATIGFAAVRMLKQTQMLKQ